MTAPIPRLRSREPRLAPRRLGAWAGAALVLTVASPGSPAPRPLPPATPAPVALPAPAEAGLRDLRATDAALDRAVAAARSARGARFHARVRALVQLAELVDPSELQAALGALAIDPSLEPSARAYAGL